jgi:predicted TIM-barrel fold metal-dependent hydrolase
LWKYTAKETSFGHIVEEGINRVKSEDWVGAWEMIVDSHVHMGRQGAESVGAVLQLLDNCGIDKAVVFPCFDLKPDNFGLVKQIQDKRGRLIPFAWLNPHLGREAVEELRCLHRNYDVKGIKLHPLLHAFFPESDIIDPLMKEADNCGLPVLFHSGHGPFSLPWQIGRVAERYPNTIVIMDHMGLQLGYADEAINLAERYPNLMLGTAAQPSHWTLKEAIDRLGPRRIIYGSDAPYIHPAVELCRIDVLDISDEDKTKIVGGNILRIVGA